MFDRNGFPIHAGDEVNIKARVIHVADYAGLVLVEVGEASFYVKPEVVEVVEVVEAPVAFRVPIPAHVLPLLGKVRDVEIARQHGLSKDRVRKWRIRLGIPSCRGLPYRGSRQFPPDFFAALGHEPDRAIAQRYGITPEYVRQFRKKRGIPCYQKAAAA